MFLSTIRKKGVWLYACEYMSEYMHAHITKFLPDGKSSGSLIYVFIIFLYVFFF